MGALGRARRPARGQGTCTWLFFLFFLSFQFLKLLCVMRSGTVEFGSGQGPFPIALHNFSCFGLCSNTAVQIYPGSTTQYREVPHPCPHSFQRPACPHQHGAGLGSWLPILGQFEVQGEREGELGAG